MKRRGFTLIELLVVIAIIALLMAILVPTLRRIRNQSRAVVCRSNLRQWGTIVATDISENDGRFQPAGKIGFADYWLLGYDGGSGAASGYEVTEGIRCCPTATKPVNPSGEQKASYAGGTFLAWGRYPLTYFRLSPKDRRNLSGSYGWNGAVGFSAGYELRADLIKAQWVTADVRGRDNIPVLFDCASLGIHVREDALNPPNSDAIPTVEAVTPDLRFSACIDRHNGTINVLFLDWSVRKVGLKELWTLKWSPRYKTAGPWTKAGGVEPQDWPGWMWSFKDY